MEPDELRLIMVIHFALSYMERKHCKVRERLASGVVRNVRALISDNDEDWFEMAVLMIQVMGWKERPISSEGRTEVFDRVWGTFEKIVKPFFDPVLWEEAIKCDAE